MEIKRSRSENSKFTSIAIILVLPGGGGEGDEVEPRSKIMYKMRQTDEQNYMHDTCIAKKATDGRLNTNISLGRILTNVRVTKQAPEKERPRAERAAGKMSPALNIV